MSKQKLDYLWETVIKQQDPDLEDVLDAFNISEEDWRYKFNGIGCHGYKIIVIFEDDEGTIMPENCNFFYPDGNGTYPTPYIFALYCDGEDGAMMLTRNWDGYKDSFCAAPLYGKYVEIDTLFSYMQTSMTSIIDDAEEYGQISISLEQDGRRHRFSMVEFVGEDWANEIIALDKENRANHAHD